ncbi:MAG: guanylate kinase [Gemmatimonadales bacterium]|nr:guanylate kinase [Gemmatimonadales bacterium]
MTGFLIVLSSPSGGGKTTIARRLIERRSDMAFSVSATTRPMRPGERDGVDYYFLTREEFERRRDVGEFLEMASYEGNLYGTLMSEVRDIMDAGRHAVLDIEIEGGRQVRQRKPDAVLIFILPPSAAVLTERLRARDTDDQQVVMGRLSTAAKEIEAAREYDYVVLNDTLEHAVAQVEAIVEAERRRVGRHAGLSEMIEAFRRDLTAEVASLREHVAHKEHSE